MEDQMVNMLLGDQVPRNGGWLRYVAAQENPDIDGVDYFRQDADSPWRETGQPHVKLREGWTDYWALAARFPWTLSVPGHEMIPIIDSLKLRKGLVHLAGPSTTSTIWGSPQVEFDRQIFEMEVQWMLRLADMAGVSPRTVPDYESLQSPETRSLVEMFRDDPPRLLGQLPATYFWSIDQAGNRRKWDGNHNPSHAYVPIGVALPLEYAARGQEIGCTSLGYLSRSLELRDRYLDGHKVLVCVIEFDWGLGFRPLEVLRGAYVEKRRKAGKPVMDWDPTALEAIERYWRHRPTSVAHMMLGGDLRPSFAHHSL